MSAIAGVLLLSASVLGAAYGLLAFRNPDGPAWARRDMLPDLSALVLVALFSFGAAALLHFILNLPTSTALPMAIGAVAAFVALTWVVFRSLRVRERLAVFDQEAEARARSAMADQVGGRLSVVAGAASPDAEPPARPTGSGREGQRKKKAA